MKKLRKWLIILIVLFIITIIITLIYIYNNRGKLFYGVDEVGDIPVYTIKKELHKVKIRNNYYIVKNNVVRFYTEYINACNAEDGYKILDEDTKKTIEKQEKECSEKMYGMLDKKYIQEFEITSENILSKMGKINTSIINITDMYVSEQDDNISVYFVYGNLRDKRTSKISNFLVMVKVDNSNKTFSIFLQDYIQKHYSDIKVGDTLQINIDENIEKNEYNHYEYKHILDAEYVEDLFSQFKEEILYNPELLYSKLAEEYKNKRFNSLEEFIGYTKNNVKYNVIIRMEQYKKNKEDGFTTYICLDQYGKSYIFIEKSVMNYTLILDTYTIDLPEFTEKYYGAEPTEKVALNIQKVFEALNNKDYKYVYNKLADGFKENYFPTLDDFEQYAKDNFYDENEVKYEYHKKESEEYYSYTIKVLDKNSNASKNLKIIMQLQSGTNFVMSFNVN